MSVTNRFLHRALTSTIAASLLIAAQAVLPAHAATPPEAMVPGVNLLTNPGHEHPGAYFGGRGEIACTSRPESHAATSVRRSSRRSHPPARTRRGAAAARGARPDESEASLGALHRRADRTSAARRPRGECARPAMYVGQRGSVGRRTSLRRRVARGGATTVRRSGSRMKATAPQPKHPWSGALALARREGRRHPRRYDSHAPTRSAVTMDGSA